METIWIGVAASIGAIGAGLLGWLGQKGEPFSGRKFMANVIRAAIAGGGIALAYPLIEQMGFYGGLVGAFLSGAGIDVIGHRLAGTIK